MGFLDKKSKNTTVNNERNNSGDDNRIFDDVQAGVIGGTTNVQGDGATITDGGAIAGNIAVANNALRTAESITKDIGDQFGAGFQSVSNLSMGFTKAIESIKKTELTGGGAVVADLAKWWPVIPIAIVAIAGVKAWSGK